MSKPYTFDRVSRLVINTLITLAALYLLYILRGVLLPFGVAAVIAYLLEPLVQFNRRLLHLKGRVIAVLVTLFGVLFALFILGYLFMPSLIKEVRQLGSLIVSYSTMDFIVPFIPTSLHRFIMEQIDFAQIGSWLMSVNWREIGTMVMSLVNSSVNFVIEIFNWAMVLLYVVFIMLDYDRLWRGAKSMVPQQYRRMAFGIFRDLKDSMNHYFRGQALIAFCVGILFSIGFLIMGMPLAVMLGFFIGMLNLVPYLQLASIPVTILLCAIYSLQSGTGFWIIFGEAMVVYIVVQLIQDLILTPKIMGKVMGLNPAIILLSLSIWGSLFGLLGMIIALPMTTLFISYYERYILSRQAAKELNNAIEE